MVETVIEDPRWEAAGLAGLAEQALLATLRDAGLDPAGREAAVLGCDDGRIAALNARFRGRARPTNVLSWPAAERRPGDDPGPELGDVAIAWSTCAREAAEAGLRLEDHAAHLLVHAALHLLGHDHEEDDAADLMEEAERRILRALGVAVPVGAAPEKPRARRQV